MSITEFVCLFLAPVMLPRVWRQSRGTQIRPLLILLSLWFANAVVTDWYRMTPSYDFLRGCISIPFFGVILVCAYELLKENINKIKYIVFGIALLEAAFAGTRPVVSQYGGTQEYYGFCAEYLDPLSLESIVAAVRRGWERGRLTEEESKSFKRFSWNYCAKLTLEGYNLLLSSFNYKRA